MFYNVQLNLEEEKAIRCIIGCYASIFVDIG